MAAARFIAVFSSRPEETLRLARSLSPQVALHPSGAVLLTVSPRFEEEALDRILEEAVASGTLHYASASTRVAALLAARTRPGSRVSGKRTAAFLAPLPVPLLALYTEQDLSEPLETLQRWGIRSLGQLAALPDQELASRLGAPGEWLQKLARGEDAEPFQPQPEPPRFQASKELDWELDGLEPLSFALADILEHLCRRLAERGLATDLLQLVFRLADGSRYRRDVPLAYPMRKPRTLLSLLRLKLQADPPQAPIQRVFVEARPASQLVLQPSLLEPSGPGAEEWPRTLARLTALLGEENLGAPAERDSHHPDPAVLAEFDVTRRNGDSGDAPARVHLALRRIRPPQPTRLRTDQIVACAGPWKSSGEWWPEVEGAEAPSPWCREEWDVEFKGGGVYRVFWEPGRKGWFLEGVYD